MLVHVAFRLIHISKGLPLFSKAWDILVSEVAPRPEKSERTQLASALSSTTQ